MLQLDRPLGRLRYFLVGVVLFPIKAALDNAVSYRFGVAYTPLLYVSPLRAPLWVSGVDLSYWIWLWGLSLPFMVVGFALTLRRLRDMGASAWYGFLFFLPFVNLVFIAACTVLPPRTGSLPAKESPPDPPFWTAVMLAGFAGSAIVLGGFALGVFLLRWYGAAVFLGSPFLAGFVSGRMLRQFSAWAGLCAITIAMTLCAGFFAAMAWEGAACIVMAAPLAFLGAGAGAIVGGRSGRDARALHMLAIVPLALFGDHLVPLAPASLPVTSEVIVAAPPAVVWERVIAFPPIPPGTDLLFRAGIAAPLEARIDGSGVGAVRYCRFTTGDFVEPIEVWNPGRELTFRVDSSPDPMRELTLWEGPRPPHLAGYLESTRGQFLLEPLPGGRTRLTGRTWYRTNMWPDFYFRLWSDAIIHRIHLRVLEHVKRVAEADASAIPASSPRSGSRNPR